MPSHTFFLSCILSLQLFAHFYTPKWGGSTRIRPYKWPCSWNPMDSFILCLVVLRCTNFAGHVYYLSNLPLFICAITNSLFEKWQGPFGKKTTILHLCRNYQTSCMVTGHIFQLKNIASCIESIFSLHVNFQPKKNTVHRMNEKKRPWSRCYKKLITFLGGGPRKKEPYIT